MGFLGLFSRKSDKPTGRLVKSQAYDATTASKPPTRGTYPIAGNGPNILVEGLSTGNGKFSQTHLSLDQQSELAAPAPNIPRFRQEDIERPSSAPSIGKALTQWSSPQNRSVRDSHRSPPVAYKKPRPSPLAPVPRGQESGATNPDMARAPQAPFARSRTASMRSDVSKGFVDILDAQSVIHPADFRTRVKAAGARDYGEDVADRNIAVNGFDVDSPETEASIMPEDQQPLPHHRSDDIALPRPTSATPRTFVFPQRTSSHIPVVLPQEDATEESNPINGLMKKTARRQSLHTYIPDSLPASMNSSRVRSRPSSVHKRVHATDREAEYVSKPAINWDNQSTRVDSNWPLLSSTNIRPITPGSPRPMRDSIALTKERTSATAAKPVKVEAQREEGHVNERKAHVRKPSSHSELLYGSVTASPVKDPSTRRSMHTIKSSISSVASREIATDLTPLAYPRNISRSPRFDEGYEQSDRDGSFDLERFDKSERSGPTSHLKHSRNDSREDVPGYPRTKSLLSSPGRSKLDDIVEQIPTRTSSLRHWSISSSASITGSTTSSNPFPRPQSRHTADTSVHSSGGKSPGFNVDDYLSSDNDDFTIPRRPRGEGEEELLFRPGYGLAGMELPGLMEAADAAPAPTIRVSRTPKSPRGPGNPRISAFQPPESLRQGRPGSAGHVSSPPKQSRRYIIDNSADDSDADDGLSEDSYYEEDSTPRRRGTKRLSALGTPYGYGHSHGHGHARHPSEDVIEEERELDKTDMETAFRLRKEAKALKRAMAMEKRRGKRPERVDTPMEEA